MLNLTSFWQRMNELWLSSSGPAGSGKWLLLLNWWLSPQCWSHLDFTSACFGLLGSNSHGFYATLPRRQTASWSSLARPINSLVCDIYWPDWDYSARHQHQLNFLKHLISTGFYSLTIFSPSTDFISVSPAKLPLDWLKVLLLWTPTEACKPLYWHLPLLQCHVPLELLVVFTFRGSELRVDCN